MSTETLVILDYISQDVHIYNVDPDVEVDEDLIDRLGFNINDCNWMVSEYVDIVKHKGKIVKTVDNDEQLFL